MKPELILYAAYGFSFLPLLLALVGRGGRTLIITMVTLTVLLLGVTAHYGGTLIARASDGSQLVDQNQTFLILSVIAVIAGLLIHMFRREH